MDGKTEDPSVNTCFITDREAIEKIYVLALDGMWKCDRKIRKLCYQVLGCDRCDELRRIAEEEKCYAMCGK